MKQIPDKGTKRAGRPPAVVSAEHEQIIKQAVQRKLEAAEGPEKEEYLARLSSYYEKYRASVYPQTKVKQLTILSIPEYTHCVDLPLAEAAKCVGVDLAWPSEDMAQVSGLLAALPPKLLSIAWGLIKEISPDFWQNGRIMSKLQTPLDRIMYLLTHSPMKRANFRAELCKEHFGEIPIWTHDPNSYTMNDVGEIAQWASIFNVSPAWLLCWTQWPVLAGTPKIENIMTGYSFLNDTLKEAFRLFLEALAADPGRKPIARSSPAGLCAGRPEPKILDDTKSSLYNKARTSVLDNAKRALGDPSCFNEHSDENLTTLVRYITDSIMNSGDAKLTKAICKLVLAKGGYITSLTKMKKGERQLFAHQLLWISSDLLHISLHEVLSGQDDFAYLPRWLSATAGLLAQNQSACANTLDKLLAAESSSLFYPPDESTGTVFSDRVIELAQDQYADRDGLLKGVKSTFLKQPLIRAVRDPGSNQNRKMPVYRLCCYAFLTGVPEDFFVSRNYIKYLRPAYKRKGGTYAVPDGPLKQVLEMLLCCKPETRSRLLAEIWIDAYFAQ